MDWGVVQANGVNSKFADCNGDGTVNANDTNAIVANFNNTHLARIVSPEYVQNATPVYLTSLASQYAPGDQVSVYVNIGSAVTPAVKVYGGDIQVSFPPAFIIPGSASRSYIPSWLGTANADLLAISNFGPQQQTFNFALSRFDHTSRSGFGPVAEIHFVLDSTLAQGDSMIITIDNAFVIDSNGIRSNLAASNLVLYIDTAVSAVTSPFLSQANVSVFPNPFGSSLSVNIISAEQAELAISWIDITGRKIGGMQRVNLDHGMNQFNAELPAEIEPGIYFLWMTSGTSNYLIKVVKI